MMAKKISVHSSVFLSPPNSEEFLPSGKVASRIKEDEKAIPFDLDDGFSTIHHFPKLDILVECSKHNLVNVVISKIFNELSEIELLRVSHVNQEWRRIVRTSCMKSGRRLSRFIKKSKANFIGDKENSVLGKKHLAPPAVLLTPLSTPTPLTQRNDKVQDATPINSTSSNVTVQPSSSTYKQCPDCQSPARTTFKQVGHCTNCDKDFCIRCLFTNNKHSPTCQMVGGTGVSGNMTRKLDQKPSKRYSIGSSGNKARLKRL